MQTMLEALLAGGIGDGKGGNIKPVAFAKVDVTNDAELEAAVAIFGGCLWGVNLQTAQQRQTDQSPPRWDYDQSGEWGGHAVMNGKFEAGGPGVDAEVISWGRDIETTDAFRGRQLEEAWIVIFPWHLEHPAFLAGVSLQALAAEYHALTGDELLIPAPSPKRSRAGAADIALWNATELYARQSTHVAKALRAWATAKKLT
jgi:hypothetical protein